MALNLVPAVNFVVGIIVFVFLITPGQPVPNRFEPPPHVVSHGPPPG